MARTSVNNYQIYAQRMAAWLDANPAAAAGEIETEAQRLAEELGI